MNHLAHFHLAWPDDSLIAGGLEGDYLKGPLPQALDPGLRNGVHLHRLIDAYTDSHPTLAALRGEFPPELRRYAGILTDLAFDHFLTQHWLRYTDIELNDFTRLTYRSLEAHTAALSPGAQRMVQRMVRYDILGAYGDWEAVPASARRVGERFRRGNPLTATDSTLAAIRPQMEAAFLDFYPELLAYADEQKASLG
ncbi:ACP phosphodiesterase [Halioglobus maricola]|uniref:acyl carrier protein phosphodiesterase n=1 Tax=Halioglobus maricola TaxID=2601894 RepID=UPI0014781246|nr:ACP phosphodiesterase [Halioglobus maricola]